MKGVPFPAGVKFGQLLVTGPPGAGKSTLITKIGGWSEEGYLDISAKNWWQSQALALRPREIHLGFPFRGHDKALAVFDKEWLDEPNSFPLDLARIRIPPAKRFFFSVDWLSKYAFEFVLPVAQTLYERRKHRAQRGTHHVDEELTLEKVENQVAIYQQAALHLHRHGVNVYMREDTDGLPRRILDSETEGNERSQRGEKPLMPYREETRG